MSGARDHVPFLMADDDPDDRLLAQKALRACQSSAGIRFVVNGEELLDYLHRRGHYVNPDDSPRPRLILLDLNMPKVDGRVALQEIKADPSLRSIPIIVMTTSQAEEDIARSYGLGVNAYITKPTTFDALVEVMKVLSKFWFEVAKLPQESGTGADVRICHSDSADRR